MLTFYREVVELLEHLHISKDKIISRYVEILTYARIECLKSIHEMIEERKIEGNVTELGMYRGDFAMEISRGYARENRTSHFSNTTEDLVLRKMLYLQNCVIKKGYFPMTTVGVEGKFVFVNLDADLYQPTLEGLRWFYPRLSFGT